MTATTKKPLDPRIGTLVREGKAIYYATLAGRTFEHEEVEAVQHQLEVADRQTAATERQRSPITIEVINTATDKSHGTFDTIEEARGCVSFDKITSFEIWQGDHIVERSEDADERRERVEKAEQIAPTNRREAARFIRDTAGLLASLRVALSSSKIPQTDEIKSLKGRAAQRETMIHDLLESEILDFREPAKPEPPAVTTKRLDLEKSHNDVVQAARELYDVIIDAIPSRNRQAVASELTELGATIRLWQAASDSFARASRAAGVEAGR